MWKGGTCLFQLTGQQSSLFLIGWIADILYPFRMVFLKKQQKNCLETVHVEGAAQIDNLKNDNITTIKQMQQF